MNSCRKQLITTDDLNSTNELNHFFLRFETQDFFLEGAEVLDSISATVTADGLLIEPQQVCRPSLVKYVGLSQTLGQLSHTLRSLMILSSHS